jgi:phosphatidylglycerophosphate synthase
MPKHEKLTRVAINTMPIARAIAGPPIANKIRNTLPQDRSWRFAGFLALLSISDFFDGFGADRIGPKRYGAWLDQLGDKGFTLPIMKALADTGEISPLHYETKAVRDAGVTSLRVIAELSHTPVDTGSIPSSKLKTTSELATVIAACSPVSTIPHAIEGLASLATLQSVTSGSKIAYNLLSGLGQQISGAV